MIKQQDLEVSNLQYPSYEYMHALGKALFNFQLLEQGVVAFIVVHDPSYVAKSYDAPSTPNFRKFSEVYLSLGGDPTIAKTIVRLSEHRSALVHARPVGDEGEDTKLAYFGKSGRVEWTQENIETFSVNCVGACEFFNNFFDSAQVSKLLTGSQFTNAISDRLEKWEERWKSQDEIDFQIQEANEEKPGPG